MWKWVLRRRRVIIKVEWPNPNPSISINPDPNGVIRRSYYTSSRSSRNPNPAVQQEQEQQQQEAWLFVGLGNPGDKFRGTRHNVGFEMVDALADSLRISLTTPHCKALFAQGFIGDTPIFLAKPQTYINLSGESTAPLAAYYKLPLDRVIVFHDDMQLPCGVLRLQHGGGHGSHNGLKSVMEHFRGNTDFARLRIGIGRPPGQMDPKAFLLQKFNSFARQRIDVALKEGVNVLKLIPSEGLEKCASWFNKEQKYKHIKPQCIFGLEDLTP